MKTKHIVLIILIGILLHMIGAYLKITHYQFGLINGNTTLLFAFSIEIIGVLLLTYKLFTSDKFKDLMNR